MTAVSPDDRKTVLETLTALDGVLMAARDKIGDPVALAEILPRLDALVSEALPCLAQAQTGPEEKAQLLQLRERIGEVERLLQARGSILAGFSHYLKETVAG